MGNLFLISFAVGVGAAFVVNEAFLAIALLLSFFFALFGRLRHSREMVLVAVLCVGLSLGMMRVVFFSDVDQCSALTEKNMFEGEVSREVVEKDSYTVLFVEIQSGEDVCVVQLKTNEKRISFGDLIIIKGVIEKPENFNSRFDYINFLKARKVDLISNFPQVIVVSKSEEVSLLRTLSRIKHALIGSIKRHLPEPHSSLGGGIILGVEESLGGRVNRGL